MTEWKLPGACLFDGRTVRYGVSGHGPPVVVVHGTPWSSFNLRHIINALSREFTVYYYDLIGYGQSDKSPGDVSLGIQNQVLDRLLDHWQLDNPSMTLPWIQSSGRGPSQTEKGLFTGRLHRRIQVIQMRCNPCTPGFPGRS